MAQGCLIVLFAPTYKGITNERTQRNEMQKRKMLAKEVRSHLSDDTLDEVFRVLEFISISTFY